MSTEDNNQEVVTDTENSEEVQSDNSKTPTLSPEEIQELKDRAERVDELESTVGSLKRDLKKAQKKETKKPDTDSQGIQERFDNFALKSADITHKDDVELAKETADKWGMTIEQLVDDPDFQIKLERLQTQRANLEATSNVKGDKGNTSNAKNSPEYWVAKGQPPTPEDVPDRKTRAKIIRAMMKDKKESKKFWNE